MKNYHILNNDGKLALKNFLNQYANELDLLINHHFNQWINEVEENKNDGKDYYELPRLYSWRKRPEIFDFKDSYFE